MHPTYFIYYFAYFIHILSDDIYLKLQYKHIVGKQLDLKKPKTFNEKLQWLKINDRNPEYTQMVDKYEVRKYIADKIGEEYLIPLLGVWDRFDDINFDKLPEQFVLKCTHDSGSIIFCKDKNTFNFKYAEKKLKKCLKHNFYWVGREWPYKNIKPRIIAEKYMVDTELKDYKIMCFNGEPKCSFVCSERFLKTGLKVTFFDLNWNVMPFIRHYPKSNIPIEKPNRYDEMLALSKLLAYGTYFLRVDFYEINQKLYFGELTFYPGGGDRRIFTA